MASWTFQFDTVVWLLAAPHIFLLRQSYFSFARRPQRRRGRLQAKTREKGDRNNCSLKLTASKNGKLKYFRASHALTGSKTAIGDVFVAHQSIKFWSPLLLTQIYILFSTHNRYNCFHIKPSKWSKSEIPSHLFPSSRNRLGMRSI